ncbi:MAG: NADAR family protein [Olsenella sp.]|nr:NADAR family protein [Olsenella sp.]
MKSVQAFVTNIVFPRDYDEWEHRFLNGIPYDIEDVLSNEYEEWTVPRWCKRDDVVFFMFAKTSGQSIAHLRAVYKKERRQGYDEETRLRCEKELERIRRINDRYGGKIFAVGRVCGDIIFDDDPEVYKRHWGSNLYADIDSVNVLERPVDISEFKGFLTISRVGAITPVVGEVFRELKSLIGTYNHLPNFLANSDATPTPLMRINRDNWIELNNEYRHSYFLEIQFRTYYVNYLLRVLGDIRKFWSECTCFSDESSYARVDNVVRFFGKYLPVEVKLSVSSEKDLPGQCRKYCHLKAIALGESVDGSECYEDHVLVIDTDSIYLYEYDNHSIKVLKHLDDIRAISDIDAFREDLKAILPVDATRLRRRRSRRWTSGNDFEFSGTNEEGDMQDRYAGDIGDYGKFGMLRALASEGLSIGINWYLVETPRQEASVNDGQKLIPKRLTQCDPELAETLLEISQGQDRSVRALEQAGLVPGASYFSDPVPVRGRLAWHARALASLAGADLVFLDPDNGLLVKSVGRQSSRSPKYAFYEEVADYVSRGQSVVVYNHRSRKQEDAYFGEISERLAAAVPQAVDIVAITFRKGSVRDYFAISANAAHAGLIRDAFEGLANGAWGKAGVCRMQPLSHYPRPWESTLGKPRGVDVTVDSTSVSAPPAQIGFWRESDPLGCCSNWHPTGFDYRGTHFSTGEHWMMWQKARLMGDAEKATQILEAPTPRRAKELGGEVEPYDGALWDVVREQLVYYGVREKFLANDLERNLLLSTGSALLAEASPHDRVWGVGMTADDPRFADPAKWEGENLLGRACMRARADIRQLYELGRLDAVRHEWPELDPAVARMTLLQLSRIPATRAAVYCYATIVSHAAPHVYPSAGAYLKRGHDATVEGVTESMQFNMGAGLPVAGWYELVRELEILHALGRL